MSAGADNSDVAGALEGETVDGTPLPRSFLVEASGPATIVRDHGDITERTEGTVEISHRIETLEEFGEFWALRSKRHPERTAVNKLLNAQDEGMGARYDQVGEWDVVIDGHVQAFFGVAEAIVGFDGDIEDFDAPNQRFLGRVLNNIGHDVDTLVADFAQDLISSDLWGPGARLAEIVVKHGNRKDLESDVEALLEEVED